MGERREEAKVTLEFCLLEESWHWEESCLTEYEVKIVPGAKFEFDIAVSHTCQVSPYTHRFFHTLSVTSR